MPQYVIEDPFGKGSKAKGKGWAAQEDILWYGQSRSAPDHTPDVLHWSQPGFLNLMHGQGPKHFAARAAWNAHLALLQANPD